MDPFRLATRAACTAVCLLVMAGVTTAQERPNILFITVDDLNNDLGTYGHPLVRSPSIDRLAAEGLRFDAAYAQYPVCSPSRSSFLTGLYPQQTGVLANGPHFRDFIPDVVTLPEYFARNGYFTARVGKIFHYNVPNHIGTDGQDDPQSWDERRNPRGIDVDYDAEVNTITPGTGTGGTLTWLSVPGDGSQHTDAGVTDAAIDLIETHHPRRTGQPLFLAAGYYRPHTPYIAPASYFEMYPPEEIEAPPDPTADRADIPVAALADRLGQLQMTDAQKISAIQGYYASITFVGCADRPTAGCAGCGEASRQHDRGAVVRSRLSPRRPRAVAEGDLFEGSVRVPLIVSVPERLGTDYVRGADTASLAELVDLYPTLVELAGLDVPAQAVGTSLVPVLEDPSAAVRESAYTVAYSRAGWVRPEWHYPRVLGESIRTERYRYTEWAGGIMGMELYDYRADPEELTNVAIEPEHQTARARLAGNWQGAGNRPRPHRSGSLRRRFLAAGLAGQTVSVTLDRCGGASGSYPRAIDRSLANR